MSACSDRTAEASTPNVWHGPFRTCQTNCLGTAVLFGARECLQTSAGLFTLLAPSPPSDRNAYKL